MIKNIIISLCLLIMAGNVMAGELIQKPLPLQLDTKKEKQRPTQGYEQCPVVFWDDSLKNPDCEVTANKYQELIKELDDENLTGVNKDNLRAEYSHKGYISGAMYVRYKNLAYKEFENWAKDPKSIADRKKIFDKKLNSKGK